MEKLLSQNTKNKLNDYFIAEPIEQFKKMEKNKSYSPILLVSPNSILSNQFINGVLNILNNSEEQIISNNEQKLASNKNLSFNVKISKSHIEVNPSECGINDKNIVSEYILDISGTRNIVTGEKKNIVIWNVDNLGKIAYESLINIIRNNQDTSNFICVCSNNKKIKKSIFNVITPIVIKPVDKNFIQYFEKDGNFEIGINKINYSSFLKNVCIGELFEEPVDTKNTLKKFIEKFYLFLTTKSKITDSNIEEIRAILYDLYVYHFSYEDVIECFLLFVFDDKKICESKKREILQKACQFSLTCQNGNKMVIHMEAFIFSFLQIFWRKKSV